MDINGVQKTIETGIVARGLALGLNDGILCKEEHCIELIKCDSSYYKAIRASLYNAIDVVKSRSIDLESVEADKVQSLLAKLDDLHSKNLTLPKDDIELFLDSIEQLKQKLLEISFNIISEKKSFSMGVTKELLLETLNATKTNEYGQAIIISSQIVNALNNISYELNTMNDIIVSINSYVGSDLALLDMFSTDGTKSYIDSYRNGNLNKLFGNISDMLDRLKDNRNQTDMTNILNGDVNTMISYDDHVTSEFNISGVYESYSNTLALSESLDLAKLSTVYDTLSLENKNKLISIKLKLDLLADLITLNGTVLQSFVSDTTKNI